MGSTVNTNTHRIRLTGDSMRMAQGQRKLSDFKRIRWITEPEYAAENV